MPLLDFLQPQAQSPVPATPATQGFTPGTPEYEQNKQSWIETLTNPAVQSGMAQFFANMTQPMALGQSPAGQFGASVAAGSEAARRSTEMDRAEQKRLADEQLRREEIGVQEQQVETTRQGQQLQAQEAAGRETGAMARLNREYELRAQLAQLPPNLSELVFKGYNDRLSNAMLDPTYRAAAEQGPEAIEEWKRQLLQEQINNAKALGSPAAPIPGAPGGTVTQAPPIPENLKGKNPGWNERTQRWQLQDGSVYDRAGNIVP